jgi:hypothetical protein
VRDKGQPLSGSQNFEDHEEGQTDGVSQNRFVLGIDADITAGERLGSPDVQGLFASHFARTQDVEAYSRHHRRQPSADVLDPTWGRSG